MNYPRFYARWSRFCYIKLPGPLFIRRALMGALPSPGLTNHEAQGVRFMLDPRDLVQANILVDGVWSTALTRWWQVLAADAGVVLDVGAHIGYFSHIAKVAAPGAHIIAFEPNPRMRVQFEQIVQANHFTNVEVVAAAAAAEQGEVTLYIRERFEPGASSILNRTLSDGALLVPAVNLDVFLDEKNIAQVDLLKMDIEGAEIFAVQGMRQGLLAGRYRLIVFDIHNRLLTEEQVRTLVSLLWEAQYHLYRLEPDELVPLTSGEAPPDETLAVHAARFPLLDAGPGERIRYPQRS
ncbi:MAG: FkbM family methyltransferase [Anaerolineae bacterium]